MHARDTKSVIIDTAVRLFNQHGSPSVSTNRIAAEMSISVGNLYYHFDNKEDIIRTVHRRMAAEIDELWTDVGKPTIAQLETILDQQFQHMWAYRFFQRERLALLKDDPLLMKRHREVQQRRRETIEAFVNGLMDSGVLSMPREEGAVPALVKAIWVISENWLSSLELEGTKVNRKTIQAGADLIVRLIRAYLAPGTTEG